MQIPVRHRVFRFGARGVRGRDLFLQWQLTGGPEADVFLEELFTVPNHLSAPDPDDPCIAAALRILHGLCGVSYFKTCLPPQIEFDGLPDDEALFLERCYLLGLGEFWFRNQIDPHGRVIFPRGGNLPAPVAAPPQSDRWLLLVGGGKDSAVSRELLRTMKVPVDLFSVGAAPWIRRQASAMGDRHVIVSRSIDPTLLRLNREGALNGHVPVTAIVLAVAWLTALLGSWRGVIASNERSADEGNTQWRGMEVNHQWSKGIDFERRFQALTVTRVRGGPIAFSLLRPLSELRIGAELAKYPLYFEAITSCNANFRVGAEAEVARWCGTCPKCLFVYLVVGPHLDTSSRNRLFGADFLANPGNAKLLRELAGETSVKPFECVGTAEEVSAALSLWSNQGALSETLRPIANALFDRLPPETACARCMAPSWEHAFPPGWEEQLRAALVA